MNIKLLIIISFSWFYLVLELLLGTFGPGRTGKVEKSSDRGSIWIIMLSIFIGYFAAFQFGMSRLGRIYHWNIFFAAGCFLVCAGLFIRLMAIFSLRKHFTYTVTGLEDHQLITTGWYKYIRHPGYLGQILIFLGVATALSNWLSILGMMIFVLAGFLYRIRVEEKFMAIQLGQKYLDYRKKTWKLIPGIY